MSQSTAEKAAADLRENGWPGKIPVYLKSLGPGLITGAFDDDPSGTRTYSQTAAQGPLYTAAINGLGAPPLLCIILLIGNNRQVMKDKINGRASNVLGWFTTIAMTGAAAALLWSFQLCQ
jgi:Mn2+/Fe2+ NRAMP family transporter